MADEAKAVEISYQVRVKPGRAGSNPEAPDWEVLELEDGSVMNSSDIYDNLSLAEANHICGMWTKKKEEAETAPVDTAAAN
ncbi:MAG: hypothetical protein ABI967_14005 [bacterium]